ncbi:reticulon-like protein B12 isoform X2 [Quercus suber]|uniref:reticulon-like protein B12 isoform X2 n=1 Tax=Quercus suber TaxID=58331 RepID=UPI000CE1D115|nr:reticulon-like protein B12 [Quercus suber]POF18202.1 reticulon-like protein b12 [Quercus suber]
MHQPQLSFKQLSQRPKLPVFLSGVLIRSQIGFKLQFFLSFFKMGSSDRLFNRQRTVHEILGGGFAADVILWRRKNLTVGILLVTLAVWLVFERSGYTLLSLVSSVFLLLIAILFSWAKSAAILNRPAPPLPELHLSEEMVNEVATFIRLRVNTLLSVSQDIALGKDSRLFFKVAAYLWLISFVGGLTDFLTLGYTSLVVILTVPALYESFEDHIDKYVILGYKNLHQLYVKLDEYVSRVQKWILVKKKLS